MCPDAIHYNNYNSIVELLYWCCRVAENRYLPLTGGIAITTLTCYTVISNQIVSGTTI